MSKLDANGCLPSKLLSVQKDLNEKLSGPDGALWLARMELTLQGKNPLEAVYKEPVWADEIVAKARRKLKKFFGRCAKVPPVPGTWTPEFLENAAKYNNHPVFIPGVVLSEDLNLGKNYIKPEKWLYKKIQEKKVGKDAITLKSGWYLADFSVGVDYTDGSQVFPNDPWSPLIERLRRELKIVGKYNNMPWRSRFAITSQEWNDAVLVYMASALNVTRAQIRLEHAGEFNFIGNVYDKNRGKFNTWELFCDSFEGSYRLCGGDRRSGGLADVSYAFSSNRSDDVAARPLVSFI